MKRIFTTFLMLTVLSMAMYGQRYLSETFADVQVTTDVIYGVNATVLLLSQAGEALPQALTCDIYEPENDDETSRPLVILLHTGNFLPPSVNGGCSGTNKDATIVELATRLAKMGYVVATANYRLGWNPVDPNQSTRVFTLINAAYRGVQDSRTCIRFFRKSVDVDGNPYGVDSDKVVVWGVGTGGYISFASATLDDVTDTFIPKFSTPNGPMVFGPINGNIDGTTVGVVPTGYPGFPEGDTLNYPNHVGYSSEFNLGVNLGGSLGDTSWIDQDDPPFISYHVPTDPFAPCGTGIVNVPPPVNLPVVEVSGSCVAQPIFNSFGVNACMEGQNLNDPISQRARAINGGIEGFYPFITDDPNDSGPWNYSSTLEPYGIPDSNCDTNSVESGFYLDTILQYYAPRAFACLDLTSNVSYISAADVGLEMAPNPASGVINFSSSPNHPIEDIAIYDLTGKYLTGAFGVKTTSFSINRGGLSSGMYIAKLRFKEGVITQKLIFK